MVRRMTASTDSYYESGYDDDLRENPYTYSNQYRDSQPVFRLPTPA
jgi:hypothetical protein